MYSDWTGDNCEWKLENCTEEYSLSCENGGLCRRISRFLNESLIDLSIPPSAKCYCNPGFTGVHCERHFTRCLQHLNLCENAGQCEETADGYKCKCVDNFEGKHCEINCPQTDCQSRLISSRVDIIPTATVQQTSELSTNSISSSNSLELSDISTLKSASLHPSLTPSTVTLTEPTTSPVITIDLLTPSLETSASTMEFKSELTPTLDFRSVRKSSKFPTDSGDIGPKSRSFVITSFIQHDTPSTVLNTMPPTTNDLESPSFTTYVTTRTIGDQVTFPEHISSTPSNAPEHSSSFDQILPSRTNDFEIASSISSPKPVTTVDSSTATSTSAADIIVSPNTNVFNARFYSNRSSRLLFVRDRFDSPHYFRMQFEFQTNQTDGVVFHARSETRSDIFAIVFMKAARLQYAFSCNTNKVVFIQSDRQLHLNRRQKLHIQFKLDLFKRSCFADLSLNDSEPVFASQTIDFSITGSIGLCVKQFQFGRLLEDRNPPSLVGQLTPFEGCIRNIELNGRPRFASSANLSEDLTECDLEHICDQNPCRNGGDCKSHRIQTEKSLDSALYTDGKSFSLISWTCQCHQGYVGRLCELAACEPNPCSTNSTCVLPSMYEYTCLCPRHRYGRNCQLGAFSKVQSLPIWLCAELTF